MMLPALLKIPYTLRDSLIIRKPLGTSFLLMDEPHALSLAFRACSVTVEVSVAHLLSGITAIHGWVGQKETIIHALCFHPHYLVQATK